MKAYKITYTPINIEGRPEQNDKVYKYCLTKEKAEKEMKEEQERDKGWWKTFWKIEEIEIEE